ncbi:hypothetical protein [Bradyrhizobium liaoningense]
MNVDALPSMAKHRGSVNLIPDRSIADIMPSDPPDRCHRHVSAHRFAGGEIDKMLHAGVTGEGRNPVTSSPCRMTVSADFNFDLDQIQAGGRPRKK